MTTSALDKMTKHGDDFNESVESSSDAKTYVTFELSGECLGVEVANVREILDSQKVNRLPNTSHDVEGVIDIRGESIPVVDMGSKLGLPRSADSEDTRIIVFEVDGGGHPRPVGVFADKVRDVTLIAASKIEDPPVVGDFLSNTEMLIGIARHSDLLILLLDIQRVFGVTDASFRQLDPMFM